MGSAHMETDDTAFFNVSGDVKTLIHIIKLTGHEVTLFLIVDSLDDNETLPDIMESSGDVGTLNQIIELIKGVEDPKVFTSERAFAQDELDMALISACRRGYTFLVHEIVHLGANKQARGKNGNTPLLICAENGFINIAKFFIGRKVNINASNDVGDTALILASGLADSVEMVKLLLAHTGICVNQQNKKGYTALMKAIEARSFDVIKLLLGSQEDTTEGLEGIKNCRSETAQDIADKLGLGSTVKFLLKYSIKVYHPLLAAVLMVDMASFDILMGYKVYDPLIKQFIVQDSFRAMFAKHEMSGENFSKNEEMIIQRLLQCGADVNDCPDSSNPILVATKVGSNNVLKMLCKHGAYLRRLSKWTQTSPLANPAENGQVYCTTAAIGCSEVLRKRSASLDIKFAFESAMKDNDSMRLKFLVEHFQAGINRMVSAKALGNFLISAARNGHLEIIDILLDAGANVNFISSDNRAPLMEANNVEVFDFLMRRGAVVSKNVIENNQVCSHVLSDCHHSDTTYKKKLKALLKDGASAVNEDPGSGSPLMAALLNNVNKNIVQLFLDHGVSVKNSTASTALLIAAENNCTETICGLLQHSEVRNIINNINHEGLTAVMISVRNNNHSAVKVLIDHGADLNTQDVAGNTALMFAVSVREPEILTALVRAGSDVSCQNDYGRSPLMLAALTCWEEALMLLVDSGADVNAVSGSNETALSLLINSSYPRPSSVEYLLNHGADASSVILDNILQVNPQGHLQFIPVMMQRGLGPSEIRNENGSLSAAPASVEMVSPLCVALMTGNVKLASYFVENLFVTKYDIFKLFHNQDVRRHLHAHRHHGCLEFLEKQSAQSLSLFSLAFIAVQSAISTAPRRGERVGLLPVPQIIKDRLMFKVKSLSLPSILS